MGILAGILLLSLLMCIHELGHYITGRLLGFKILEFSLFMGPVLFSRTSKKTNIKYSFKLFPIGASVRFLGEEGMGEKLSLEEGSFPSKEKWKRAVVIATGPLVNILSGVLALLLLFGSFGFSNTTVGKVQESSQAQVAGIKPGDRILAVNQVKIVTSIDYEMELAFLSSTRSVNVVVLKADGKTKEEVILVPQRLPQYRLGIFRDNTEPEEGWLVSDVDPTSNDGVPVIQKGDIIVSVDGISPKNYEEMASRINESGGEALTIEILRYPPLNFTTKLFYDLVGYPESYVPQALTLESRPIPVYSNRGIELGYTQGYLPALGESFKQSASIIKLTFRGIGKIFSGEVAAKDSLAGPVGVVSMIGNVVNQEIPIQFKLAGLLWMFALISLNLGVFNLLPIPALDGSHLLLIAVEGIRGKKLDPKIENVIVLIGFAMIITLALIGFVFDIMRLSS